MSEGGKNRFELGRRSRPTNGSMTKAQLPPSVTGSQFPRGNTLAAWRESITQGPGLDSAHGAAGVYGGEWDSVDAIIDNARGERNKIVTDGVMKFTLTDTPPGEAPGLIYVWRPLVAVDKITIDEFSWPTLPAQTAMKTNRAELSVLIRELQPRAAAAGTNDRSHFRGRLSVWEPTSYLYFQSASITDAMSRSIGARAEWYRDKIRCNPPVMLNSLTVEIRRGGQLVTFQPYRLSVNFDFADGAGSGNSKIQMSLDNGEAHNLEAGMNVYFETAVTDGSSATVTEFAADTALAVETVTSATVVEFATSNAAYATTSGPFNVLIPARRVQFGLQFRVARVERE
jgi:hypothetical protein